MKWVKQCLLFGMVIMTALSLAPQNVFGAATNDQKESLIDNVCEKDGDNAGDLWGSSDTAAKGIATKSTEYKDAFTRVCKNYFVVYLNGTASSFTPNTIVDNCKDADCNVSDDHVGRIKQHVDWWGNAKNQISRSDNDWLSFMKSYCEHKDGKTVGLAISGADITEGYYCVYQSGKMLNPFCAVAVTATYTPGGGGRQETKELACYAQVQDAEDAINIDSDNENTGSSSGGDTCGQSDSWGLGWIFCGLGRAVTGMVDALINDLLLPMLQWRMVV